MDEILQQHGLKQCLEAFIEDCRSRDYSEGTLAGYRKDISVFIRWAWQQNVVTADQLTRDHLTAYQLYLPQHHTRSGKPLKPLTQKTYVLRLYAMLRWLTRQGTISFNPADQTPLPSVEKPLPDVLSEGEVQQLIAAIDVQAPFGVRDRAIIETLYANGMRGLEAARLTLEDLSLESGWVMIQQGKWKKDRRVPLTDTAVYWISEYLDYERVKAKRAKEYQEVFLTAQGIPYQSKGISFLVSRYLKQTGLRTKGGSHLLRHSIATHMLQNGADIRYIQQMLGHSSLLSTQVYTRVQDAALKDVHDKTHPARIKSIQNNALIKRDNTDDAEA